MKTVFIGGSRHITGLRAEVVERLRKLVAARHRVVIGDADGADKAVQHFLNGLDPRYPEVEVFCSGPKCRNNLGLWPERHIDAGSMRPRSSAFYEVKDGAMSREADVGLMIWDGDSVGTLRNVKRLSEQRKRTVIFLDAERRFADVRDEADWRRFLLLQPPTVRLRMVRKMGPLAVIPRQQDLF